MSWLGFANHFLSNQRLHAWSWINKTFSWKWFFFVGNLALSVLGLFLFCFCLVWGEQVTDTQDFGWQSKGEDHFRSWFPFFSCLLGDYSVLFRYCLVQRPFCIFLLFSSDLWSIIFFLFCFLPLFDWEFSPFAFFRFFDREFYPFAFFQFFDHFPSLFCFLLRERMGILTLGQGLWWVGTLAQGL